MSEEPIEPSEELASPQPEQPAPEPRRRLSDVSPVKRRLVTALIALYGVAVIAAGAVLWRAQARGDSENSNGVDMEGAKGILSAVSKKDGVGVVEISGAIYRAEGGKMFEKGAEQWARRIEKLAKKDEVKAVVLLINSPGGSVGAVQEIHSVIERLKAEHKKPFVAHLGDVAASGGYYLAAACDKVVAHPGSLVGSIGVIFSNPGLEQLFGKIGLKMRIIKSGKMKDIGSSHREMTEEEKSLLQDLIDNSYAQFFAAVQKGRKLEAEKLKPLADGRIFTGEQCMTNGLVDELGDTRAAILLAAKLGGISDDKPKVYREGDSFSSMFEAFESRLNPSLLGDLVGLKELKENAYHGLEYRWAR